jgi:hypothetical protein
MFIGYRLRPRQDQPLQLTSIAFIRARAFGLNEYIDLHTSYAPSIAARP